MLRTRSGERRELTESARWRCGKHEISLARPRIMGVLNVTPDSFSDGGEHFDPDAAIEYGLAMLDAGATRLGLSGTRAVLDGLS